MAYTNDQIAIMDSIIARYPRKRSAIMPLLHYVQSIEGYVTNEGIELIGKKLDLATAEVTAVSTFYTQYKSKPVVRWGLLGVIRVVVGASDVRRAGLRRVCS
jgi:NADH-quinone oxidoreductase subunit E